MIKILTLSIYLAFVFVNPTNAQINNNNQNIKVDTYNERYTPEGRKKAGKRGTYKKDTHVWVYTSAFAKRLACHKNGWMTT